MLLMVTEHKDWHAAMKSAKAEKPALLPASLLEKSICLYAVSTSEQAARVRSITLKAAEDHNPTLTNVEQSHLPCSAAPGRLYVLKRLTAATTGTERLIGYVRERSYYKRHDAGVSC